MGITRIGQRLYYILSLIFSFTLPLSAQEVLVADISKFDWQETLLFTTLQGIANREKPRLYLLFNPTDILWLNYYRERFKIDYEVLPDPYEALSRFKGDVKGYVLWDEEAPDTANIATVLAGLEDYVAVSPSLEERARAVGWERKEDLRGSFRGKERWEIYRWAFDRYWQRCNHRIVACLDVASLAPLRVDLTPFLSKGKEIYIRFEDAQKEDGMGAKLHSLRLEVDGNTVAEFRAGSEEERRYLHDAGSSWLDRENDRVADGEQYWVYRFRVEGKEAKVLFNISQQYLVRVGNSPQGPFVDVAKSLAMFAFPHNQIRDFLVANRCFVFDLSSDPSHKEEFSLREEILGRLEPLGLVLGWVTPRDDEGMYVSHASQHGAMVVCCINSPNFSLHRLVGEVTPLPSPPPPPSLEKKVYISFILSDGDALHWDANFQGGQWLKEDRGKIPFGWELQPLLLDLAPGMFTYYVETATPQDCLVASASGIGYTYPDKMPSSLLPRYLQETKKYLQRAGFKLLTVFSSLPIPSEDIPTTYQKYLSDVLIGCQEGYISSPGEDYPFPNFIWLKTRLPRWDRVTWQAIKEDIENLASLNPQRPLFIPIHLFCYSINFEDMLNLVGDLDPMIYRVVRPDQLFQLARDYFKSRIILQTPPLLTVPPQASLILPLKLRNTYKERMSVRVKVGGDWEVSPSTRTISLEGGRSETLDVKIRTGSGRGEFKVEAEYKGGKEEDRLVLLSEGTKGEYEGKSLRLLRIWEGEELAHQFGELVEEGESLNGRSWRGDGTGYLLFGPYEELEVGRYLALFRMKGNVKGILDVFCYDKTREGREGVLAQMPFADLGEHYMGLALPFEVRERQRIEYRVFSQGGTVYVDRVEVFKVEGD